MYDLFAPLVEELDIKIDYEQAKQTVKESLMPLGEEYVSSCRKDLTAAGSTFTKTPGKAAVHTAGALMVRILTCC